MTSTTRKKTLRKTRRKRQGTQHTRSIKNEHALLKNDYYTYVNLKWLKKTIIPKKYNIVDDFSTLQRKINKQIERTIVPTLLKDKNIHNLYDSIYQPGSAHLLFINSQYLNLKANYFVLALQIIKLTI